MISTTRSRALLSALVLALAPGTPWAGVHKCLDQNNKVFYQDKPCQEKTSAGLSPALSRLNPGENRPQLLWQLGSGKKSLYLLGGLGFGTADMYPLPEKLMDAFAGANVLVIVDDLDTAGEAAAQPALIAKGEYKDGTGLEDHVKPGTWRKALELAKSLDIAEDTLNAQRPWLAALNLRGAALKRMGYDEQLATAKSFVKAAETLKPIVEFDPQAEQAKRFDGMADAEQEAFLLEALHEADARNEYFKALDEAWRKGDPESVEFTVRRALVAVPASQKSSEQWLKSRNEALARSLDEMAADGRTYFVVVDARRVVGEAGLLAALEAKGFRATRE